MQALHSDAGLGGDIRHSLFSHVFVSKEIASSHTCLSLKRLLEGAQVCSKLFALNVSRKVCEVSSTVLPTRGTKRDTILEDHAIHTLHRHHTLDTIHRLPSVTTLITPYYTVSRDPP